MPELISIGRFARLSGLSPRALRLYDEVGILAPAATSLTTGYRYYSRDQLAVARRIRELRRLDFPLAEIRALLATPEPGVARAQLAAHRAALERQLLALQRKLERLANLDDWCPPAHEERNTIMEEGDKTYICSFCAKPSSQVERMIAGPHGVIICNRCVDLCNRIIAAEQSRVADTTPAGADDPHG